MCLLKDLTRLYIKIKNKKESQGPIWMHEWCCEGVVHRVHKYPTRTENRSEQIWMVWIGLGFLVHQFGNGLDFQITDMIGSVKVLGLG